MQPVVQTVSLSRAIKIREAEELLGGPHIFRLARAARWLSPIVQERRLTRFDYQECRLCWDRIKREGFEALQQAAGVSTRKELHSVPALSPVQPHSDCLMKEDTPPIPQTSNLHPPDKEKPAKHSRGLWKHKNGHWYFSRQKDGRTINIPLKTKDLQTAEKLASDLRKCYASRATIPFKDLVEEFLEHKIAFNEYTAHTIDQRRHVLNKLGRWLTDKRLSLPILTLEDMKNFYMTERKVVKEATVQGYIVSAFRPFFRWLKETGVIKADPVKEMKMARLTQKAMVRERFCDEDLRDQLLALAKVVPKEVLKNDRAIWLEFILHAGFEAGMRKNEITEARPDWFDLNRKCVTIPFTDTFAPKMYKTRIIPLTDGFLEFLKTYPMTGQWCIAPDVEKGKRRYRYDIRRPFNKFIEWAGKQLGQDLRWVTPHVMRHTFSSLLINSNVSLFKVSRWLGDTERTTAKHYAHLKSYDDEINQIRKNSG